MGPPLVPMLARCFCGEDTRFDPEEVGVMAEKIEKDRARLQAKCGCGRTISLGKDEFGWYIQGATSITIGEHV